jgi:hypothetical protein
MKNIINFISILSLLVSLFCGCKEQDKNSTLSIEKVYIVECNWSFPDEDEEDGKLAFRVIGFSELDKDFNLKFAYLSAPCNYYTSNMSIADSLKNKIAKTIERYPTDTTFLDQGNPGWRVYDGNSYVFIFKKNDGSYSKIYFEPKFLPEDLIFLYNCLYNDRQKQVWKNQYAELFMEFEEIILSGANGVPLPPPPILKETIEFTPPIIKKY